MNKLIKYVTAVQFLLAIVLFFVLNIQFGSDPIVMAMLESKDSIEALHRLSVYYIPGLMALSSLFMIVFDSTKILLFSSAMMIFASGMLYFYMGKSVLVLALAILSSVLSLLYLLIVLHHILQNKKSR